MKYGEVWMGVNRIELGNNGSVEDGLLSSALIQDPSEYAWHLI